MPAHRLAPGERLILIDAPASRSRPDCLRVPPSAVALGAILLVFGCAQRDVQEMTAAEKAVRTEELRTEAEACWNEFKKSGSTDIDALACALDHAREMTEIHPSPVACPSCYYRYGYALHLMGIHWWEVREDAEQKLARAARGDEEALRRTIAEADEKVKEYFEQSINALEAYFSTRESIDPQAYDWVSRQAAQLGDYKRAIRYLNLFSHSTRLGERDQLEVAKRIKGYKALLDKQERTKLRERLDRSERNGGAPDAGDDLGARR